VRKISEAESSESFLTEFQFNYLKELNPSKEDLLKVGSFRYLSFMNYRLMECRDCINGKNCLHSIHEGQKVVNNDGLDFESCPLFGRFMFQKKWASVNIPKRFRDVSFENFIVSEKNQKAFEKIQKNIDKSLLISGTVGTGKTHLAISVLRELVKQKDVRFISVPRLLYEIRKGFESNGSNLFDEIVNTEVLVLDDLGAEKPSQWVEEQLFILINTRYENELQTIITTNCTLEQLTERLGERIVSRLLEMCVGILLTGKDFRKERGL